jgi:hypothetical protein
MLFMHPLLQHDLEHLDEILEQACDTALTYLRSLPERPVSAPAESQRIAPGDDKLSEQGVGAQRALAQFWHDHAEGLSASAGPRYFAFVTGGGTPAALAADWLVSAIDQNTQLSFDSVASALEVATLSQLKQLLGLPESLCGSFVSNRPPVAGPAARRRRGATGAACSRPPSRYFGRRALQQRKSTQHAGHRT